MKDEGAPPAQEESVRREPGPYTSHKTTSEWAARVARERLEGTYVGVLGTEQRILEERIHRLIGRVPLTVWQRAVIRAQLLYEARRRVPLYPEEVGDTCSMEAGPGLRQKPQNGSRRDGTKEDDRRGVGWGTAVGTSTGGGLGIGGCQEPCGLTSLRKRQRTTAQVEGGERVMDRCPSPAVERPQSSKVDRGTVPHEVLSAWLWATRRPRLTVLQTEEPALLDSKQVTDVLGTALAQFMNAVKHAKKRATPAQEWTTTIEATVAPAVRAVLEAAWKWDGIGGQPDRGQDGPGFEAQFLVYRACYTVATESETVSLVSIKSVCGLTIILYVSNILSLSLSSLDKRDVLKFSFTFTCSINDFLMSLSIIKYI
jgi:hypothetical protein